MIKQSQQGSSLVEVMVALFVLAIGLLGVLAMQTKSMQYNQSAYTYSRAVFLANDLAERIRNNDEQAAAYVGEYEGDDFANFTATNCYTAACTEAQLASWDVAVWDDQLGRALPGGQAEVASVAATGALPEHMLVEVSFDDSRSEGAEVPLRKTYSIKVGI